jgi:hypothetical protein
MAYIGNSPSNTGNYQQVDDISSSFNGSTTSFALEVDSTAITPAKDGQLLVSINGVMQEPDSTGTNGFKVSSSNIVFSAAPAASSTFWAIYQGQSVDVGTPSAGTVGLTELSATGTASGTTFLRGDNTWVAPTDSTKLPLAGGALTGAVTTNSTFDGRDVATDGTKLDTIEAISGSTTGQLLTSTGSASTWQDAPQGVSNSKLFYFGSFT